MSLKTKHITANWRTWQGLLSLSRPHRLPPSRFPGHACSNGTNEDVSRNTNLCNYGNCPIFWCCSQDMWKSFYSQSAIINIQHIIHTTGQKSRQLNIKTFETSDLLACTLLLDATINVSLWENKQLCLPRFIICAIYHSCQRHGHIFISGYKFLKI